MRVNGGLLIIRGQKILDNIRPTVLADVEFLSNNLRVEDVEEVEADGFSPLNALTAGFDKSIVCYTMVSPDDPDLPIGMLGVVKCPVYEDFGVIWLLGSDEIKKHSWQFLSQSRPVLNHLFDVTGCKGFYNKTYHKNIIHHQWLKWLRFKFISTDGVFHTFVKLRG